MAVHKPGPLPDWPPPPFQGSAQPDLPLPTGTTSSGSDETAIPGANASPPPPSTHRAPQGPPAATATPQPSRTGDGLRSFDFGSPWPPFTAAPDEHTASLMQGRASDPGHGQEHGQEHSQPRDRPYAHLNTASSLQQPSFPVYQPEPLPLDQPASWPSAGFFSAEQQALQHANNGGQGVSLSMLEMGQTQVQHHTYSRSAGSSARTGPGNSAGLATSATAAAPSSVISLMAVDEPTRAYDPWRPAPPSTAGPAPGYPPPTHPREADSPSDPLATSPRSSKRSRNESDSSSVSALSAHAGWSGGGGGGGGGGGSDYSLLQHVFGDRTGMGPSGQQHNAASTFGGSVGSGPAPWAEWDLRAADSPRGRSGLERGSASGSASGSGSGSGEGTGDTSRSGSGSGASGVGEKGGSATRPGTSTATGNGLRSRGAGPMGNPMMSTSSSAAPFGIAAAVPEERRIVQRADKSCKKCRERRVRCDRAWPTCARCQKRRETCEWTDVTNVDEVEEGGDAEQIAQLQAKVVALERQLKSTMLGGHGGGSQHSSGVGGGPKSPNESQRAVSDSFVNVRGSFAYPMDSAAASIPGAVQDVWTKMMQLGQDEGDVVARFVAQQSVGNLDLGRANVHWRIGQVEMARHLTCHLMEAALYACCSKLPGIKPLADRIDYYKTHLDVLEPAQQCAVAVLCALGARASPHSQLLGVSSLHLQDGTPNPPAYLHTGERRELACRQLEARARELCWSHNFFQETELPMLDGMVGLVQLLIFEMPSLSTDEEVLPRQSRFFARNAIGMYFDIRHDALERGERTSRDPRMGPGCALFLADAIISSASSRPSYITTGELDQYIVTDGVQIPDFPNADLGEELRKCTARPLTMDKLVDALTTACLWVCGCARLFAQLSTGRRKNAPSTLPLLKSLWKLIDRVHNAIQELQQLLVGVTVLEVVGCEDEPFGLEHFVLLGVRYDSLLVDLINLQHVYLMKNRNGPGAWAEREDDPLLAAMRQESELRVRKCLRLASFYAQLYLQSQDKHLVHHMLMELEMLPDWTTWAAQRVGTPGGPISEEYEVTVDELDWFQQALELSSYYTPKAAHRLQALAHARKRYEGKEVQSIEEQLRNAPNPLPASALPDGKHVEQHRAAIEAQETGNPRYHYDLPPNSRASFAALAPPDDPQHMYHVSADDADPPSPSQLYIWDTYGIASAQGQPLMDQIPIPSQEFVQDRFSGSDKWSELGVRAGQEALESRYAELGEGPRDEQQRSDEWMRSAGRGRPEKG